MILLTTTTAINAPVLELKEAYELWADCDPDDPNNLADQGWRYAEYRNTGARVLVSLGGEPRVKWSQAWMANIQTVTVREVGTVANIAGNGVCVALGEKGARLITRCSNVDTVGYESAWRE